MATKLDKVVTYDKKLPPTKLENLLNTLSCEATWKIENISPLPQCLWPPNLAGYLRTMRRFPPLSQKTLWSRGLANSTTTVIMSTKLGRVFLYNEGLPLIKLQNLKITWQMKYVTSLLPQDLWSLNLARRWVTKRSFHPWSHATI